MHIQALNMHALLPNGTDNLILVGAFITTLYVWEQQRLHQDYTNEQSRLSCCVPYAICTRILAHTSKTTLAPMILYYLIFLDIIILNVQNSFYHFLPYKSTMYVAISKFYIIFG